MSVIWEPIAEIENDLLAAGWECISGRTMTLWRHERFWHAVFSLEEAVKQEARRANTGAAL